MYVCVWCISLWLSGSVLESPSRLDEEHRLIARYAARLAVEAGNATVSVSPSVSPSYSRRFPRGQESFNVEAAVLLYFPCGLNFI